MIDLYFRHGRNIKWVAEFRSREESIDKWNEVFIDQDKYQQLKWCEECQHIPAFYVAAYLDGLYATRIKNLVVSDCRKSLTGRWDRTHIKNQVCPTIVVPAERFDRLCSSDGVFETPMVITGPRALHVVGGE